MQTIGDIDNCYKYLKVQVLSITPQTIHAAYLSNQQWNPIRFSREYGIGNLRECAQFIVPYVPVTDLQEEASLYYSLFPVQALIQHVEAQPTLNPSHPKSVQINIGDLIKQLTEAKDRFGSTLKVKVNTSASQAESNSPNIIGYLQIDPDTQTCYLGYECDLDS